MTAICSIAQIGEAVLRQVAEPLVIPPAQETVDLAENMLESLQDAGGVGLAAPQIRESKRLIIVASKPTPRYPNAPCMIPTVMLNPVFKTLSENKRKDWEGCLSIPGIRALVPRFTEIEVNYFDLQGIHHSLVMRDFVARVFQHEYDHLDGLLYLDRVENNRDIISEKVYQETILQAMKIDVNSGSSH